MLSDDMGLLRRLQKPEGPVDVVLDTDAYNEIDDQYALSYLALSGEKLRLKAIYAAPFLNEKSKDPGDGMEKSYEEIMRLLALLGREDLKKVVYKGSRGYLPDERTAVSSPAAEDLCRRAMAYSPEKPLYVVAIGAITNVASALIMRPEIRDRVVIVWLGGQAHGWPDNLEFNLMQDVAAGRVIFGCGAAVVQLPCMGVVSGFAVSGAELRAFLSGKNPLCDYLVEVTEQEAALDGGKFWSRIIWDVTAVAWLLDGEFMRDRLTPSPIPEYDHHYAFDNTRHFIRYVYHIERDALLADLFQKLGGAK